MSLHYPPEFRRGACERMLAGEAVKDLAVELGVGFGTLYRWRRQALIDAGLAPGVLSYEADRLVQARRRIAQLEDELAMTRAASELFAKGGGDPKGATRL